jgi:hypothetical protein
MPELRGPRRLHGGEKSETGARVKADSRASGGASAPALRRATGSDTIKTSNSSLTQKTVAQNSRKISLLRLSQIL